jgi:uncharacterized protein
MHRPASSKVTPVTFPNADGLRLFGMLHEPAQPRCSDTAVLLLSPGVKMRVAPHRLYNKMTEHFLSLGFPVFRFDFHGLGDSEGEAPERLLADLYGATQVGRYIADTIAAMDWYQRERGISRFIASGLCGGALTGLLTAERDPRIVSLLSLSIPVILDGSNIDPSKYMTRAQLAGTRSSYLRKLRVWDVNVWRSWKRLLTLQSDYRLMLRSLLKPLAARLSPTAKPAAQPSADTPARATDNTNPHFAPAFRRMISTARPVLLLFAETDRLYWEFDAKFFQPHAESMRAHEAWYTVHVTPQANHIFSAAHAQREMLEQCTRWLEAHWAPVAAGRGPR